VCALSCDGERVSTLGLQGGRLLRLFIGAGAAPWVSAAGSVFASEGVPIDVYRIGPEEVIQDLDGRWAQLTGLSPEAALLVRSDHFVGWRADTLPRSPTDELRKVIRQILPAANFATRRKSLLSGSGPEPRNTFPRRNVGCQGYTGQMSRGS
jgi:hypothetical protein